MAATEKTTIHGVIGDFNSPDKLLQAVKDARVAGYSKMEAYTPFPIHGIDEAMGAKPSILGFIVLCGSATGLITATTLMWYTGTYSYPLVISGKPLFAFEFALPIMFELTILLSAFAAIFGMFALNGLPRLFHPLFNYSRYPGLQDDRFGLVVEAGDRSFDVDKVSQFLKNAGADHTEVIHE
jgi:Protein of unknown function (DUF3341)